MKRFASVILVDRRGWILMQERDEHPLIDPELWSLSGGHVDEGEEFEPAAYRELAEETGVELAPGTLRLFEEFDIWHEVYGSTDRLAVYVAGVDLSDDDIDCREGRQIVFVDPATLDGLPLSETAGIVVPALLASPIYADLRADRGASHPNR